MKHLILTLAMALMLATPVMAFDIERTYRLHSTSDYYVVVLKISKPTTARCAMLDAKGNALAVSMERRLQPPLDEVSVRSPGGGVASSRCWIVK